MYEPHTLKRWEMPSHYFGEVWPNYFGAGVGQSRDSSALERSNFKVMLKELGGESDTVVVVREGHWAVGWVEWIAIHQDDEKSLKVADELAASLEDYPVLSDDAFSEEEDEEAQQIWTNCYNDRDRVEYLRNHRDQFDFHSMSEVLAVARGRYFNGYASELLY